MTGWDRPAYLQADLGDTARRGAVKYHLQREQIMLVKQAHHMRLAGAHASSGEDSPRWGSFAVRRRHLPSLLCGCEHVPDNSILQVLPLQAVSDVPEIGMVGNGCIGLG